MLFHQALNLSLSFSYSTTQVRFSRKTEFTFSTFSRIKWNHMISWFYGSYVFTDSNDNSGTFMAKYRRKYAFWIFA